MTSLADRIRSCEYLYLESLTEPSVNAVKIIVLEAKVGSPVDADQVASKYKMPELRSILARSRHIEHMPGCSRFELVWQSTIAYSIVNESYSNGEPESSVAVGGWSLFAEYTRSRYLDYLAHASFASKDYPGPYRHWALYCQNHTIDIASQVEPVIRELGPESSGAKVERGATFAVGPKTPAQDGGPLPKIEQPRAGGSRDEDGVD